jgi:hypothetical protein
MTEDKAYILARYTALCYTVIEEKRESEDDE